MQRYGDLADSHHICIILMNIVRQRGFVSEVMEFLQIEVILNAFLFRAKSMHSRSLVSLGSSPSKETVDQLEV
jgi:hypothetical protein